MENAQSNTAAVAPVQNHAESDEMIVESNDLQTRARNFFERRFGLDEDEDERDGIEEWNRQDALQALRIEFWESHPDRHPDDLPEDHDVWDVNDDHPEYDLYKEIQILIHAHYDEIEAGILDDASGEHSHDQEKWAGTETSLIRKTESQLMDAITARRSAGGYKNFDGRIMYWKECLPSKAEILLPRFVNPRGAMHPQIAGNCQYLGIG